MEIKVLGGGCDKCLKTAQIIDKVLAENNINATVEKVTDVMQIAGYGVMRTPAVVIDGKVKIVGKVPSEKELLDLLSK